ncbi:PREDICTED: collagen and calcium-binding EGF domain-containing protein 1-like [Rhagoletis zephyria]|uniref:collagen and calcium-binding EGF domain-containing protein 1-like n=1 Tax=Rhagoletis zephyria TaxID=28612 RepID=UPI0008117C25|nr:PREDICTED: collagen and calcium-binding EGF domain-containing protein 1-like [Rhagoletis zephyria]
MYTHPEPPGLPFLLGEVDNKIPRDPTEDIEEVGTIGPQGSTGRDGRDDAAGQQSTLGLRGGRGFPLPNRLPGAPRQKEFMDRPGPKETREASVRQMPYCIQAEEEFDNYDYE